MSRFGDARWQRLAAWSGAALAWGSTITAVVLEPARVAPSVPPSQAEVSTTETPLPVQPASGLLVIRYRPDDVATQPAPLSPAPAAAAPSAPRPTSSGS